MEFRPEPVNPENFKKRFVNCQGVDNLDLAINILRVYQDWRGPDCVLTIDDLGIHPSLITAALEYVLAKFGANKHLYNCSLCRYCKDDRECTTPNNCTYERISDEI